MVEDEKGLFVVSTHSRPKAAGVKTLGAELASAVSTHSRPKAAGVSIRVSLSNNHGFNTQPPEGGWYAQPSSL